MTNIKGVKGLALCTTEGCWNMYPLSEKNSGKNTCPGCREENREIERVETDEVTDYRAIVYGPP